MKLRFVLGLGAGLVALLAAAPTANAHSGAIPIDNPATGVRCYLVDDHNALSFWVETNGYLGDPSTPIGTGTLNHELEELDDLVDHPLWPAAGTGLQRNPVPGPNGIPGDGDDIPADTHYADPSTWASICFT